MRRFYGAIVVCLAACGDFELAPATLSCSVTGDCPASFECKEHVCSYCATCVGADTSGAVPQPSCAASSGTADHNADVAANPSCAAWLAAVPCFCHGDQACLANASVTVAGLGCIPIGADPASYAPGWTTVCTSQRASIHAMAPSCAP